MSLGSFEASPSSGITGLASSELIEQVQDVIIDNIVVGTGLDENGNPLVMIKDDKALKFSSFQTNDDFMTISTSGYGNLLIGPSKDELGEPFTYTYKDALSIHRRYPNIVLDDLRQEEDDEEANTGIYFKVNHGIKSWMGVKVKNIDQNPWGELDKFVISLNPGNDPSSDDDFVIKAVDSHARLGVNNADPQATLHVVSKGNDRALRVQSGNEDQFIIESDGRVKIASLKGEGNAYVCVDDNGYLIRSEDMC